MTGVHKWSRHGLKNFAHNDSGVAFTCDGNRLEVCSGLVASDRAVR